MAMRTTFSRNSTAGVFGPDGDRLSIAADQMRVDYDPQTLTRLDALIEEQIANTCLWSDDLTKWSNTGGLTKRRTYQGIDLWNLNTTGGGYKTVAASLQAGKNSVCFYADLSEGDLSIRLVAGSAGYSGQLFDGASLVAYGQQGGLAEYISLAESIHCGDNVYRLRIIFDLPSSEPSFAVYRQGDVTVIGGIDIYAGDVPLTTHIPTAGAAATRAADFFDAPGALNEYGPGLHTWRNAVRMSRDPGEPTILSSAEHRIYAKNGRLHLDGPGELIQPDREFEPGEYVPFIWNVQFPGAAPDFALGRAYGDSDWWNGHLVDINPFPRQLTTAEINAWVNQ